MVSYDIEEEYFGAIRLDGLRAALITSWPGAIREGNGTMQVIIDERADESQRDALLKILTGGETDDMATIWWVFSAMCPNKLEPLFLPIEVAIDVEARRGHIWIPGIIETIGEPIRNPVTGAQHRARIQMPEGVEFRIEGRAGGLQKQFQIFEDAPRLARQCAVLALAALRVDRHHARAKDQPAGPDRWALVMAVFPAKIEARHRGGNDIAHATSHRRAPVGSGLENLAVLEHCRSASKTPGIFAATVPTCIRSVLTQRVRLR
jgi:hypothetical protein